MVPLSAQANPVLPGVLPIPCPSESETLAETFL